MSPKRIHEFQIADHLIDLLPNEYDGNEPIFPKLYSDNEKQLNEKIAMPRKHMQPIKNDIFLMILRKNQKVYKKKIKYYC